MAEQSIGNGLVEAGPAEPLVLLWIGAEALAPVGGIAKAINFLRLVLEGKVDQGIGFPVAWGDLPDRCLVRVKVPLTGGTDALPVHAKAAAIAHVFGDHPDGFDRHHRHGIAPGFKGKISLPDVGRLDGDALSGLHRTHLYPHLAVGIETVLPDAFFDVEIGLVDAGCQRPHEPAGAAAQTRCRRDPTQHGRPAQGPRNERLNSNRPSA